MQKIDFQKTTASNTPIKANQSQSSSNANMKAHKIDRALAEFDQLPASAHVRLPTVTKLFGVSKPTIYRWIRDKKVPTPKHFGDRVSCWNVGELRNVLNMSSHS